VNYKSVSEIDIILKFKIRAQTYAWSTCYTHDDNRLLSTIQCVFFFIS